MAASPDLVNESGVWTADQQRLDSPQLTLIIAADRPADPLSRILHFENEKMQEA